jgi:hypothetical protein
MPTVVKSPLSPELEAVIARALTAYPAEEARIRRGAEIVQRGGVRIVPGQPCKIGIYHTYPQIAGKACPCPDSALGHAAGHRCKHRWALTLWQRLQTGTVTQQVPALRELLFYATWRNYCQGVARIREDGACWFEAEEGSGEWVEATWEDLVLAGRKDLVDAYWHGK